MANANGDSFISKEILDVIYRSLLYNSIKRSKEDTIRYSLAAERQTGPNDARVFCHFRTFFNTFYNIYLLCQISH